jgi:hypothetical protein
MSTTTTEPKKSSRPSRSFDVLVPRTETGWLAYFSGLDQDSLKIRRARRLEWARETLTVIKQSVGVVPFEPFDAQEEAWLDRTGCDLYLKQREIGMSADAIAWHFADFVFDGGSRLIAANKESTIKGLFRDYVHRFIRDTQDRWPSALPEMLNKTSTSAAFGVNGIAYKVFEGFGASLDFASGFRYMGAILDEFAKWARELAEPMYTSLLGTLVKDAEITIPFTPFGMAGLASELWHNAEARGFARHNFTLYELQGRGLVGNPDHDLGWFRGKCRKHSDAYLAQEYFGDFIQSGRPWIDGGCLPVAQDPLQGEDIHRSLVGLDGLQVYLDAGPHIGRLVSFTDTAEGLAHGDWNVTTAWDADTGRQVYQLRDRLPPEVHAANHHAVTQVYQRGMHVFEINNTSGGAYREACKHLGTAGVVEHRTTTTTRPDMEKEANRQLRLAEIRPASATLLEECRIVCYDDKGKVQAPSGYHDDCWMSMCGAAYHMARGGSVEGFGAVGKLEAGALR